MSLPSKFEIVRWNMKNKTTKNMDKKTLFIVIITGVIITIVGILSINILSGVLADWTLPDTMKNYYPIYDFEVDNVKIPTRMEYLTNNGKLYAFCHSLSAIIVAIILYNIVKKVGVKFYEKSDKNTVKSITKVLGLFLLFLGILTFTSKVDPNNNIEKYIINFNPSDYSKNSNSSDGNRCNVIGYFKPLDIEGNNNLVAVYEAPEIESALSKKEDCIERLFANLIKNIDKFNNCTELVTLILGIYVFVLKKFQEEHK